MALLEGEIEVLAEEIQEGDVMTDGDGRKFRVLEVQLKPKTIVLRLLILEPPEAPFRLKRGEVVAVKRG